MLQLNKYDIYIFDCDGVILDSNQLKIVAMKNALEAHFSNHELIEQCLNYFRCNFGKSRFHHVSYFLDYILTVDADRRSEVERLILASFSKQCRNLYLSADVTPGFFQFLEKCKGSKYVASGSEQEELREVFEQRGLDSYFDGVFGSPTPKVELVKEILKMENKNSAVLFGDAVSDLFSARENKIDFVFYSPYSNVIERLSELSKCEGFPILKSW
ncbi:HAD family hydrolase [Vibrio vulnificus]|nr:HAD family hydrolase [Vibrio vulnificus]EHV2843194.1 HAD family hydrolase [Vibrio vulnificus]EIO3908971.1 HAD family hydrolase [Vibrio vulnificus]EIU7596393.1 HAD family hydrolase [Vibrio vulnificus]EIV8483075.1 HAD family hydrolase [Vibrio vulnificus]